LTEEQTELIGLIDSGSLVVPGGTIDLERVPPILAGQSTEAVRRRVERFYFSIAAIFEAWVRRRKSHHTQRAYRQDIEALIEFLKLDWPKASTWMLTVSVADIMAWRDSLEERAMAPKTINRRISSLSSFYRYLQAVAAEMRLPIVIPNPAHAQFISRASQDPVDETKALTATRARQLMGLPQGDDVIAYRDRAILRFCLYTGVRIGTVCRARAQDFHLEGDEATFRIAEKGDKRRTIGIHFAAAEAIMEYTKAAGIESGPLFRPRAGSKSLSLSNRPMTETAMYLLIMSYLMRLPNSIRTLADGKRRCLYSPHSLRATTATLLLDASVDIRKVQELLGHRNVTTTQIYDKRRRTTKESASHDVPI
jgi:site-specific recombinase XerD